MIGGFDTAVVVGGCEHLDDAGLGSLRVVVPVLE
jgi:hypothetical protein